MVDGEQRCGLSAHGKSTDGISELHGICFNCCESTLSIFSLLTPCTCQKACVVHDGLCYPHLHTPCFYISDGSPGQEGDRRAGA